MHIEDLMYQVSNLFLTPVLFLIGILFVYAFFALGTFTGQWFQRRKYLQNYRDTVQGLSTGSTDARTVKGYRLFNHFQRQPSATAEYLDILALKELETSRIVTRIAPMLGLVGTMIPMGPALKSLADGNVQGISENLIVAFAAVTFGLVTASITFCLASIHKRWLASELHDIQMIQQARRLV